MSYHEELQNHDTTDTATAATNKLKKRIERRVERESLEVEAKVRKLVNRAEEALAGDADVRPAPVLDRLHWYLWLDPARRDVLSPASDAERWAQRNFKKMHRDRERGVRPDPVEEFKTLSAIAKAQGYLSAVTDKSQYAPVTMEVLGGAGVSSSVEESTPIGRLRVPHDSTTPLEERAPTIPHESCDHILTVALPRSGKDSTGARICGNLKDEHNYKWMSILDDGRNELPMIAIPSDDDDIRQSLDQMGQAPKGYKCNVYVPQMPGLPDELPGNHVPFTIGLESLTPKLVLRLAGITSINSGTQSRIQRALDETRRGGGSIEDFCDKLEKHAEEMEATIQITQLKDDDEVDLNEVDEEEVEEEIREISYTMGEDDAMRQAAHEIARLAGDGLLADKGASTNLDMEEVIKRQDTVAALSCNFLGDGHAALQYTIMDLWMELAYSARQKNTRLPRVAMEIRELKNLAPSKMQDTDYRSEVGACRQTLFKLASQGSAERVMLVGSTQKINDVYKAVRTNMATKIALRNGEDGIGVLESSHNLNDEQRNQIKSFDIGSGMLLRPENAHWPIQWCGARCGLGHGDRHWLDRYGHAWGARVRETPHDKWYQRFVERDDIEWWVETNDVEVRDPENPPEIGQMYSEWYLLPRDFEEHLGYVPAPEEIDEELVGEVLEERREYPVPNDLSLQPVTQLFGDRVESYRDLDEAREQRLEDAFEEHDVPKLLQPWAQMDEDKRHRMLRVCHAVQEKTITSHADMENKTGISSSTLGNYLSENRELGGCVVKDEDAGEYKLTPTGEKALELEWDDIVPDV